MPCYHFNWHAYGTWLPDHDKGFVHWSRGYQRTNVALAQRYREQQKQPDANFDDRAQRAVIEELEKSAGLVGFRLHFVAFETTHLHVVPSWRGDRPWKTLRRSIRRSISVCLNQIERRTWLARNAWTEQVESQEHFDYLVNVYLPSHRGWKWNEKNGMHR